VIISKPVHVDGVSEANVSDSWQSLRRKWQADGPTGAGTWLGLARWDRHCGEDQACIRWPAWPWNDFTSSATYRISIPSVWFDRRNKPVRPYRSILRQPNSWSVDSRAVCRSTRKNLTENWDHTIALSAVLFLKN